MKTFQQSLALLIVILWLLPGLQTILRFVPENPLDGFTVETPVPNFEINTWKTEEFQQSYAASLEKNFGFNTIFIRLFNQLQFSLFNTTSNSYRIQARLIDRRRSIPIFPFSNKDERSEQAPA